MVHSPQPYPWEPSAGPGTQKALQTCLQSTFTSRFKAATFPVLPDTSHTPEISQAETITPAFQKNTNAARLSSFTCPRTRREQVTSLVGSLKVSNSQSKTGPFYPVTSLCSQNKMPCLKFPPGVSHPSGDQGVPGVPEISLRYLVPVWLPRASQDHVFWDALPASPWTLPSSTAQHSAL